MTKRSQRRKDEIYGYRPPITGFSPNIPISVTAAGAVGRILYSVASVTGGTPPFTYVVQGAFATKAQFTGPDLKSLVDPIGLPGPQNVPFEIRDRRGITFLANLNGTLT